MIEIDAPRGFRFAGMASGIKKAGKPDLALIVSDGPATCAGVYTKNKVVAAPLRITRENLAAGKCQAILVNSGNANACTGAAGMQAARETLGLVAGELGLAPELIAISSTGVIGQQLRLEPFKVGIPQLAATLSATAAAAVAEAIRTTDAYANDACAGDFCEPGYKVLGLAKGAGMIHPNMATMLSFVLTDADVEAELLDAALRRAVAKSFNSITVDGDTSTNDMVLVLANGHSGATIAAGTAEAEAFCCHLDRVLLDLAKMIVRDGEGASKLVQIKVVGAADADSARVAARSVATSSLVKTAFFGEDANWGRIIAAVGYSGIEVDQDRIDISFDSVPVTVNGLSTGAEREAEATEVLKRDEFIVTINLNQGEAEADYYTSDLGYEYVRINADYRT